MTAYIVFNFCVVMLTILSALYVNRMATKEKHRTVINAAQIIAQETTFKPIDALNSLAPKIDRYDMFRPVGTTEQEMRDDVDCEKLIAEAEERAKRQWKEEQNVKISSSEPYSSGNNNVRSVRSWWL